MTPMEFVKSFKPKTTIGAHVPAEVQKDSLKEARNKFLEFSRIKQLEA
jgi:hypothetical protein